MYPEAVTVSRTQPASRSNLLVLVLLWLVFYGSYTLFTPALLDDADSVHAEVAREMLLRHDYVTLYANGIRYLEKAPLYYWSMAASMKLFGASAAASRLPLALSVLALALLIEAFGRMAFRSARAGLYAGLITLSSFGIFIFSRINIPDVIVCLWLTLALYAFYRTEREDVPSREWCYLFATAAALNILTKGLIGIVFPVAIVGICLVLTRGIRGAWVRARQFHLLSSSAIFLLIAVPWHVLIGIANPTQGHPGSLTFTNGHWQVPFPSDGNVHGWTWFYFVNEQFLRYLNLRRPADEDTSPLWLFFGLILIWLMPWSAFLFSAIRRALPLGTPAIRSRLRTLTLEPTERTNLFLICWAVVPLAFFSLSTRQEYYVLPSLPPMILLIAIWLCHASPIVKLIAAERDPNVPRPEVTPPSETAIAEARRSTRIYWEARRVAWVLLALGTLTAGLCLFFILHTSAPAPDTDLSTLLNQNPGDYALSFGHFLDLNAKAMGMFRLPLALTALALFGGTLANLLLRRRNRPHAANLSLVASSFLFLIASHRGLVIFSSTLSSEQLAKAIAPQLHPQDLLVIHGEYEAGSTLGFYLHRRDIHIWDGRSSNLWYGSFFPDAPKIFETTPSIAAKWAGPQRIFVWQDPNDHDRPLPALPGHIYTIATSGGKTILSNQSSGSNQPNQP